MPNNSWIFAVAGLLFCGFLPDNSAASGAHYSVKTWTTEDGLPQNSVIAMTQTRDGYLWLGTLRGLARFDGVRFTVFDEDNTPGSTAAKLSVYLRTAKTISGSAQKRPAWHWSRMGG